MYGWSCLTQFLASVSVSFRYISSLIFINLWLKSLALTGSSHKSFICLWSTGSLREHRTLLLRWISFRCEKITGLEWTHWGSALPERPLTIDSSIPLRSYFLTYALSHAAVSCSIWRKISCAKDPPAIIMPPRRYPIGTTFLLVFICWTERSRMRHKVHASTGTVLGNECPYCFCAQNTKPLGCSFQTSKCSFSNFPAHTPLLP